MPLQQSVSAACWVPSQPLQAFTAQPSVALQPQQAYCAPLQTLVQHAGGQQLQPISYQQPQWVLAQTPVHFIQQAAQPVQHIQIPVHYQQPHLHPAEVESPPAALAFEAAASSCSSPDKHSKSTSSYSPTAVTASTRPRESLTQDSRSLPTPAKKADPPVRPDMPRSKGEPKTEHIPATPSANAQRRTFPCRDFFGGVCRRGKTCKFAHVGASSHEESEEGTVCQDFRRGACQRRHCRFVHSYQKKTAAVRSQAEAPPAGARQAS